MLRRLALMNGDDLILPEALRARVETLAGWTLTHGGTRIRRDWTLRDFNAAMAFLNAVAEVAEQEQHHPDLHLEGYRKVWIEIFTHSAGGLTDNDFRLAARIDAIVPSA